MKTRVLTVLLMGAVSSAVLAPGVTRAEEPTTVPEVVQVEDPAGDANYLNPQGGPGGGDQTTPTDLTISDILKVWFSNDADNISAHIQTEAPPPSSNAAYQFRVFVNPGDNEDGCLRFVATVEGPTFVGDPYAELQDACADVDDVAAELLVEEMADGTGVITITVPRTSNPAFTDAPALTAPWADVRNATGPSAAFLVGPIVDNTEIGTDYTIATDEPSPPAKKGCSKGKGKKKGCKKGG
jgi:hypothetical protein